MNSLSSVVWSEGMYLGPHHFQAQNRYFEDSVHFVTSNLWADSFGLIGFDCDAESLQNGIVALVHARGIFPDGLAFHMPQLDPLSEPRNLADLFPPGRQSLDLFLAVPPYRPGGFNCAAPGEDGQTARYLASTRPVPDENTGGDEQPVDLGRKNIRLLLDTEVSAGMVTLPLARIQRDSSGRYIFDPKFIPPCLNINASLPLMSMMRRLVDILNEKAKAVARPRELGTPTAGSYSAQGIANAWFLHCVNSSLLPLRHLGLTRHAHPEELYLEMSRLAGALCTFGLDSHPFALPLYDHMRLQDCFEALDLHIRTHLELIVPSNCVPIPLEHVGTYFWEGKIADQRVLSRSRWIFAIHSAIGEAEVMAKTPRLVKVCSKEFLPRLISRALPALTLHHLPVPPPALSPKLETQYFGIDKAGPCWEHLVLTREVGVYVPGELPDPEVELLVVLES